jgi:hypothetical protein
VDGVLVGAITCPYASSLSGKFSPNFDLYKGFFNGKRRPNSPDLKKIKSKSSDFKDKF